MKRHTIKYETESGAKGTIILDAENKKKARESAKALLEAKKMTATITKVECEE